MNPQDKLPPAAAHLLAEKLVREAFRVTQAYGRQLPIDFAALVNDLGVMAEEGCLQSVSLRFTRPGDACLLAEYTYTVHPGERQFRADHSHGLAFVPLPEPFEVALVAQRDLLGGAYTHRLRLNWGAAPDARRGGGHAEADGNTTERTGGRASKQVFMDDSLRRAGRVRWYARDRQYGFITGPDGADVFFHARNAAGFEPLPGQPVTFLPMVTPRGLQAKDVRRA